MARRYLVVPPRAYVVGANVAALVEGLSADRPAIVGHVVAPPARAGGGAAPRLDARAGFVVSSALARALAAEGAAFADDAALGAACAARAGCSVLHAPEAFPLSSVVDATGDNAAPRCAAVVPYGELKLPLMKPKHKEWDGAGAATVVEYALRVAAANAHYAPPPPPPRAAPFDAAAAAAAARAPPEGAAVASAQVT